MMSRRARFWVAVVTIAAFAQTACYNRYFITKDELEKLESGVEVQEVVTVQGDCPGAGTASVTETEEGPMLAASEEASESSKSGEEGGKKASDASPPAKEGKGSSEGDKSEKTKSGCSRVPVSTSNAINVVMDNGEKRRVTPFNFMMSEEQLVSPEYDLLLSLDRVKGANVREFSTWKTVGMIAGVTAVTVGTFVGLSLTSEEPEF